MNAPLTLTTVMFDSADPATLADFYCLATGWTISESDGDFVYVAGGPINLAFQRVDGYQGPGWPSSGKHAHLDFKCADVEKTVQELLAAGAKLPDFQPGEGSWTVLTDPEGHPFCVSA